MDRHGKQDYNYGDAGFSRFFRRSIDNPAVPVANLSEYARTATQQAREINFTQSAVSGAMAGVTQIGTKISLDGIEGRISLFDDAGNEVGRIGKLD